MQTTSPQEQNDLLTFDLPASVEYARADTGKRFLNYIIDVIVFYLLFLGAGVLIAIISPESVDSLLAEEETASFALADRLISLVLYAVYMSLVEAIFKGKSLGKLITGTRAVNLDGSRISVGTAFARGFSRAVPFCAFSALGTPCNPWQDKWTNTIVVEEKRLTA